MNDQEPSPWEKWKSFNRQVSNDPTKRRKHTIYGFLCALTLIGIYNLLPASVPDCNDSDAEALAIELLMENVLVPQLKAAYNHDTVDLWTQEGRQHLQLVTTEEDYSTDNTNHCTAGFHARKFNTDGSGSLTDNTPFWGNVEYSVSLSDDDEWYVSVHDLHM